jgi:hypothetical protein
MPHLGHGPKFIFASLYFSQQWGDVSRRGISIKRSAVRGGYLNAIVSRRLFFLKLKPPAERTRRSADPVASTPGEIPLFGPIAIAGMKEGLVFPSYFLRTEKSYFRRIAFIGGKVQSSGWGGWGNSDSGQEQDMPVQDFYATQAKRETLQEEKALMSAVARYFETAPSKAKSPEGVAEASIVNALHRYFDKG